ncbi:MULTISPECIES: type II toxin-antitoxin system PemK/MazF family toxin [Cyanophyceae]|uniref:Transcriptional regulator n=1 Tax=Nodularia spumigena CENA596 TaxID=1819295 RepID=A0A166I410_NODSP|nr:MULTISPECIES: type II toxin-antitoxin system PemK/MazF family toxin [Cyanophyceae]MDB9355716.1 type II toxin-antitoxin system PemK/MazF family toxin [Nodularia spumigena CS-587/03]KZL47844.1 transcriptional regulator [Nodularia spumigena CENA596]MDB9320072.1 type II toxin-antitoxin system PemK/MazF family toxin [Nodularia spumigena CS-590/01A]MDB9323912.1 type II toxin-antitoxin system PemK/MazF family toxin [Nodularia spumigena CS-591/07A]MDB9325087.1 type II toxin-antitoxin system PemK/Ma
MGVVVNRFDVFLVSLDPTIGSEIQKTRPCLVISPNEINHHIATVIVAPMTIKGQTYPTRVTCQFQGQNGQIVLDQIRTVDKTRLVKFIGQISVEAQKTVLDVLAQMFAE